MSNNAVKSCEILSLYDQLHLQSKLSFPFIYCGFTCCKFIISNENIKFYHNFFNLGLSVLLKLIVIGKLEGGREFSVNEAPFRNWFTNKNLHLAKQIKT